ncbi:MAG: hypothetical protein EHM40_15270 [Chloroflexi bacterium]|nr:MAG: hypothetical protein EHM40_15270 [Chloroflexota bacterium]
MSQILIALSVWLHALATVILIGHYLLLSLIYIPVLAKGNGAALSEISKRSRSWLYISLLVFAVTGTYLMLIDSGYLGFMDFGNFWGIVMFTKHILIFAMLAFGFWFNAILRVGPMLSSKNSAELGLSRFRLYSNLMTISGVLVLLLTALAQVE